jgi:hypothetical protein
LGAIGRRHDELSGRDERGVGFRCDHMGFVLGDAYA